MTLSQSLIFLVLLLSSFGSWAQNKPSNAKPPFQAGTESLEFRPAAELPFTESYGDGFIGVLIREDVSDEPLRQIDLYHFPQMKLIKVKEETCREIAKVVFGVDEKKPDEWPLKLVKTQLSKGPRGPICDAVLKDEAKESLLKERRIHAGVIHGQTYAMITKFRKPANEDQLRDLLLFWKSLK